MVLSYCCPSTDSPGAVDWDVAHNHSRSAISTPLKIHRLGLTFNTANAMYIHLLGTVYTLCGRP